MQFEWNPDLYDGKHDFVAEYGGELVTLLSPQKDETILDLGCGTGDLTRKLSASCKRVIGIDSSVEMIRAARSKYPEISFIHASAETCDLDVRFDAVFSSSVLHWITEPEMVIRNINRHLKTGGRFVAEFGGKGCVSKIITTLTAILDTRKVGYPAIEHSLYYPSVSEYTRLLEGNGFEVSLAMLFDRPTELKGGTDGLKNFVVMFFSWLFDNASEQDMSHCLALAEKELAEDMLRNGTWFADYRRIRTLAIKTDDC